jgi:hypothetical protein
MEDGLGRLRNRRFCRRDNNYTIITRTMATKATLPITIPVAPPGDHFFGTGLWLVVGVGLRVWLTVGLGLSLFVGLGVVLTVGLGLCDRLGVASGHGQ